MTAGPLAKRKIGRYVLGERVGSGASGGVHIAWAENSDGVLNRYAVKIHPIKTDLDRDALDGFRREAAILSKLTHNNFTKFHEFGALYDCRYIVMEYVDGITVKELIDSANANGYKIDSGHVLYIISSIANALNFLNQITDIETQESKAILHGDLTPDNVMINTNGEVKIIDFGVSYVLSQSGREARSEDHGKLRYISPRRVNEGVNDWREDLYSLGVIAYELLAGRRLYGDLDNNSVVELVRSYDFIDKQVNAMTCDPEIKILIKKMIAADPKRGGHSSVDEFHREVQSLFSKTRPGYISKDMASYIAEKCAFEVQIKNDMAQDALNKLKGMRVNIKRDAKVEEPIPGKVEIRISDKSTEENPWPTRISLTLILFFLAFCLARLSDVSGEILEVASKTDRTTLLKYISYNLFKKPMAAAEIKYESIDPALTSQLPPPDEQSEYLLIKTFPPGADVYIDNVNQEVKTPRYFKLNLRRPAMIGVQFANQEKINSLVAPGSTVLNIKQSQ